MSTKMCRICMVNGDSIKLIFIFDQVLKHHHKFGVCETPLSDKLNSINIKINCQDNLPHFICAKCIKELEVAHIFKQKSDNSAKILSSLNRTVAESDMKSSELKNEQVFLTVNQFYDFEKPTKSMSSENLPELLIKTEELETSNHLEGQSVDNPPPKIICKTENNETVKYTCQKCNTSFVSKQEYEIHRKIICSRELKKRENIKYICIICNHEFATKKYLNRHISRHMKGQLNKPSKRDLLLLKNCDVPLASSIEEKFTLPDDQSRASDPIFMNGSYSCAVCGMCFASSNVHSKHFKKFHPDIQDINSDKLRADNVGTGLERLLYTCYYDNRVFATRKLIWRHMMRMHLMPKTKSYKCRRTNCNRTFESIYELEIHKAEHEGQTQSFICNICAKTFITSERLKAHKRCHSNIRNYLCSECGKAFASKGSLQEHLNRHLPYKLFNCEICGHGFASKGELSVHNDSHIGLKPYVCDVEGCNARYTRPYTLTKHKRVHTGEKPYSCDFCSKTFRERKGLVNHRRTHTGERPYKCPYENCGKAFTQKFDMTLHTRIHTNEKPHICQICGMAFRQPSTLKTHIKGVHKHYVAPSNEVKKITDVELEGSK